MIYQDIINLLETNHGLSIFLTVFPIVALETIIYVKPFRSLLMGALLSELVFIALTFYLIHMSKQSLEIAISLLVITGSLLVGTYFLKLFTYMLLAFVLMILYLLLLLFTLLYSVFNGLLLILLIILAIFLPLYFLTHPRDFFAIFSTIYNICIKYPLEKIGRVFYNFDEELMRGVGGDAGKP